MLRAKPSFSLVELLIVIVILSILGTISIASYNKSVLKAKISEGMQIVEKTNRILTEYYSANGAFPSAAYLAQQLNNAPFDGSCGITIGTKNVQQLSYCNPTDTRREYYGVCFQFYVGSGTGNCLYVVANPNNSTTMSFTCGIWDAANSAAPAAWHIMDLSYLPSGCNAQNLSALYAGM